MIDYRYFTVGDTDPTFYREPVGEEYRKLEVWLRPFAGWRSTIPRRRHNDQLAEVAVEDVPIHLRSGSQA